jgi:predicted DNA-binding transcriptional regulator YafY
MSRETHSKLQRWTDLVASLLTRQYPATFEELAREVPGYAKGLDPAHRDSVKRTFERDKDELRDFGVPIETITQDDGETTGYRLKAARFYLPYLTALDVQEAPAKAEGYRALPEVPFEPDEITAVAMGAARVQSLGSAELADDARNAARKLAFDIPAFEHGTSDVALLGASTPADAQAFETIADALRDRRTITFTYSTPSSGATTERHVDPYGLFFLSTHWYLAAFDRTRDGVRNFRLSRMTAVSASKKKSQYTIPTVFKLREHAASRSAWELGDAEQLVAEVEFTETTGAVAAAARAGEEVSGRPTVRRFPIRRADVFARWLLSFAGAARPLSPPALVSQYQALVRQTLANYTRGA